MCIEEDKNEIKSPEIVWLSFFGPPNAETCRIDTMIESAKVDEVDPVHIKKPTDS